MGKLGKRNLNKAQTRIDILNSVYQLSQKTNFRSLKVKSIAEQAGITEMTFFNYYKKKEDILRYMMGVWAIDLMALQINCPLAGEAAIRRIFSHTAAQVKKHPLLMVNFISYIATSEIPPSANEIEAADRYLLYPDVPSLQEMSLPSGNEMLMQHLLEINPAANHDDVLVHLASCFYGDVIVAHSAGLDIDTVYSKSLDLILNSIS